MKNLVLLVSFSDLAITYTTNEYNALFNTIGYTTDGAQGSMKDYYNEASYNQLNVDSVVVAPVTLANGYAYYGANDAYGNDVRPQLMVQQALAALDARGFDFSALDSDSDGWVDGLTVIHAGGGEEYGGNNENYIWSHQWELPSAVAYDGKQLLTYHTEPARRGWDDTPSSQGITRIGVICHENGHFLGLPDLYDYGYDSQGVGEFCLMAGGSWNGDNGTQPAHMSAWCKTSLGWVSATTVTTAGTYTVPRVEDHQTIFRLSGAFPSSQYFLVENRQGYGFDASMPGSTRGLLIWHVDETQPDNDDQTHFMVDLEEASGTQHLQSTNSAGDDADYFRTGTMTTFTSSTTPNNRSYASVALGMDITAVSASGTSMTFTVSMNTPVSITGDPQSRTNNSGTSASFTVTATGTAPLYYQWQKNSTNIGSATNATYTIATVAIGDAGNYRCKVSNIVNVATSGVASLTVYAAPAFNALGTQGATVGVARAFTVSATGNPTPALALQSATATGGSYTFTNATGVLTYAPPVADMGTRTFTFTASNSSGVATQAVSVIVSEAPPPSPASIWASATNSTDFTAAWSSVSNATDYRLDVGTNATFSGGGGGGGAGTNGYHDGILGEGTGGAWTETGLTQGSGYLISQIGDSLITPAMDFTVSTSETLMFKARTYGGANSNNNTITLSISTNSGGNWTVLGTRTPLSTTLTAMSPFDLSSYNHVQVMVKLENLGATAAIGAGIDDVLITNLTGGSSASYVAGYSNRTVAGTSQSVTGLTASSTYYFRARAVNGSGTGTYSSVANVTTASNAPAGTPPAMNAVASQAALTGRDVARTVTATPTDGDPILSYACTSVVNNATWAFDTGTGYFLFVPTAAQLGSNVFSFTATDKDGASAPAAMTVTVSAASAPTVNPISAQFTGVGATFEHTATATEPDGDAVTFACTSAVDEATWMVDTNGYFLFYPTAAQLGSNIFSFTASDRDGTSAPVAMVVRVNSVAATNAFEEWVAEEQGQDPGSSNFVENADYDGDGKTTWEEYVADTDPTASNSVLTLSGTYFIASQVSSNTGQIRFSFPASTSRYYQLEYCTGLTNHIVGTTDLGWGVPGMVVTSDAPSTWYGVIRAFLQDPAP